MPSGKGAWRGGGGLTGGSGRQQCTSWGAGDRRRWPRVGGRGYAMTGHARFFSGGYERAKQVQIAPNYHAPTPLAWFTGLCKRRKQLICGAKPRDHPHRPDTSSAASKEWQQDSDIISWQHLLATVRTNNSNKNGNPADGKNNKSKTDPPQQIFNKNPDISAD